MHFARYKRRNRIGWGLLDEQAETLQPFAGAFNLWAGAICAGGGPDTLAFVGAPLPLSELVLLPPAPPGAKIVVVAANYLAHLDDMKAPPPTAPVVFVKPYGALAGPRDDIAYPALSERLDYQVELAAVIGRPLKGLANPMQAVLGYALANNITARDLMFATGTLDFFSSKGIDRSTPFGPWIAARAAFGDGQPGIRLTLSVNGETRQDDTTVSMRWSVSELLAYVDARSALAPGDVVFTGTAGGVGQASGRLLAVGDLVEAEARGVGRLSNRIVSPGRHSAA